MLDRLQTGSTASSSGCAARAASPRRTSTRCSPRSDGPLEADVNVGVVRTVVARIHERAVGLQLSTAVSPSQQIVKIVNDELTALLGGESLKPPYACRPPTVILMAGCKAPARPPPRPSWLAGSSRRVATRCWSGRPSASRRRGAAAHARPPGRRAVFSDDSAPVHRDPVTVAKRRSTKPPTGRDVLISTRPAAWPSTTN